MYTSGEYGMVRKRHTRIGTSWAEDLSLSLVSSMILPSDLQLMTENFRNARIPRHPDGQDVREFLNYVETRRSHFHENFPLGFWET